MLKNEAKEIVKFLEYVRDWNCSPTLSREISFAIGFYEKQAGVSE